MIRKDWQPTQRNVYVGDTFNYTTEDTAGERHHVACSCGNRVEC